MTHIALSPLGFLRYYFGSETIEVRTDMRFSRAEEALSCLVDDDNIVLADRSDGSVVVYCRRHAGTRGTPIIPYLHLNLKRDEAGALVLDGRFSIARAARMAVAIFLGVAVFVVLLSLTDMRAGILIGSFFFLLVLVAILCVGYYTGSTDIQYMRLLISHLDDQHPREEAVGPTRPERTRKHLPNWKRRRRRATRADRS